MGRIFRRSGLVIAIIMLSIVFVVPTCAQIEHHIDTKILALPKKGGKQYTIPTEQEFVQWKKIVSQILADSILHAANNAVKIGYRLSEWKEDGEVYYVLQSSSKYWGTYIFNNNSCRSELIIQVPHPLNDMNTGRQGIRAFKELDARVFCLSGTHRYNNEPFSDPTAHHISIFQATTEIVHDRLSNPVFVQLHGFGKQSTDPDIILSNGTRVVDSTLILLQNNFLSIDSTLTFKVSFVDQQWTRLLGLSNPQGRYINVSSKGVFIHLEQSFQKVRDTPENWKKVSLALAKTYPCKEFTSIEVRDDYDNIILQFLPLRKYKVYINGNKIK